MTELGKEELTRSTYAELRALAGAQLARLQPGVTLQPTALVHEAWLKVSKLHGGLQSGEDRRYFFFAAGRAMRDILVEEARRRHALKRGGGKRPERLSESGLVHPSQNDDELLAVHEVLSDLERESPQHAQVVLLRFFAGLSVEETAVALDKSVSCIERRWRFCKAWIRKRLDPPEIASGD